MMEPGRVQARLRQATADQHQALERELDAGARLSSLDDRRALLPRYYRLHASADAALFRWLGDVAGLDHASRQRTPLLEDDLRELGLDLPDDVEPLEFASRGEALGFLYVLEGSSLGGRVILKGVARTGADAAGLSFLDPYGAETGERWRGFLSVLEREGAGASDAVEAGGRRGFEHARRCLLDQAA